MVELKIVKSKKQQREFIKFADNLYKENGSYVPYYHKFEKNLFYHKKNPNLLSNEIMGVLAYQEGRIVGRILCISNRIEMSENKIVRFSHFDCINDSEVSFALLGAVCDWAKKNGAESVVGDLGFNDLMQCGIVLTGNTYGLSTFQQKFNFDYYIEHFKNFGFNIQKKFNEYQLILNENFDVEDADININRLLSLNNFRFVEGSKKFKISMYGRKIFDLLYENSVSSYPSVVEDKVYNSYFKFIKTLFESEDLIIVINDSDEVVGVLLITRNTSLALQTTCGNVLVSKRMYTVGGQFKNEYDISLCAISKKSLNEVCQILSNKLAITFKLNNYYSVYTNVWINTEAKKQIFAKDFDVKLIRTRAICQKSLVDKPMVAKTASKLVVKKRTSDLVGRARVGNRTVIK